MVITELIIANVVFKLKKKRKQTWHNLIKRVNLQFQGYLLQNTYIYTIGAWQHFWTKVLKFILTCYKWINYTNFPCGSAGKESTCNLGNLGSIPGLGRSPGEGKGYLLQYSGLENSMDCVHGVAKSWIQLSRLSLYTKE